MNNNDLLIRLRYALDIKDIDMLKIFSLGGGTITKETLRDMLIKQKITSDSPEEKCSNDLLEIFLNGLIIYKRGRQKDAQGKEIPPTFLIKKQTDVNNVLIKKVKIALSLTSEDIIDVLRLAGVYVSDSEISAILRKEGQRNYKVCGDRYARNFIKGLTLKLRQ